MRDCIAIAKALGDPQRVRAMMALRDGALCLCQLIELLKLSPSTVSKHMTVLGQARLVESRKEGRWVYYRLAGGRGLPCVSGAIRWLKNGLRKDPQVCGDARRLKAVCRLPKEEMGACYKRAYGRSRTGTRRFPRRAP
jgi:DNA-binding transcriptional ArsR family regulator